MRAKPDVRERLQRGSDKLVGVAVILLLVAGGLALARGITLVDPIGMGAGAVLLVGAAVVSVWHKRRQGGRA